MQPVTNIFPALPPPVRQVSILPRVSFRFAVTRDTLASGEHLLLPGV